MNQMAKNSSLSHRVTNDLRRDIVAGAIAPGAWLKTDELAARYAVSANPVREALWRLQGEGFVVANPNQGARVRTVDDDFIRNIFEIREAIEPIFVRRFCQRATPGISTVCATPPPPSPTSPRASQAISRRSKPPTEIFTPSFLRVNSTFRRLRRWSVRRHHQRHPRKTADHAVTPAPTSRPAPRNR